ncbi:hypothetical protein BSKO_04341 [Bryopsis sp. KO-2023]|nr:hypothetical protein BSKO_04341 [Bryopsis sp. KO-2023]
MKSAAVGTCTQTVGDRRRLGARRPAPRLICRSSATPTRDLVRPEINDAIEHALDSCLTTTDLPWGTRRQGKVRDTYDLGDKLAIVTTDRQSAFDRILASIPFKGQVLNQVSSWWFNKTSDIVPNGLLSVPDPNVSIMDKVDVFPVEFVMRGFMTGSTETSLWTHYKNGSRNYCGNAFPDGLTKNSKLESEVLTPTTKSETRDVPVSAEEILNRGLMTEEDWEITSTFAKKLFSFGGQEALKRGLLLVDTKYEFGKTKEGKIVVVDEVHTPDSSRYWLNDSYMERHMAGEEPESIDKEFLRLWFKDHCDPYKDEVLPEAPASLVEELSRRYILLYEKITGEEFELPDLSEDRNSRIVSNLSGVVK